MDVVLRRKEEYKDLGFLICSNREKSKIIHYILRYNCRKGSEQFI